MVVNGVDLDLVQSIEIGGAGIRITYLNQDREFVDGERAFVIYEAWKAKNEAQQ